MPRSSSRKDLAVPTTRVTLSLLGEARVTFGDVTVSPDNERLFALLLILTLSEGRVINREWLAETLWPAEADEHARKHSLRQLLYKLRQLGGPVDATPGTVCLSAHLVDLDVAPPEPSRLACAVPRDVQRYAEQILAGFDPSWSTPLREWVDATRGQLVARIRTALLKALELIRNSSRWDLMQSLAKGVLAHDPLNEYATIAFAESLSMSGSKAEAIQTLERYESEIGGPAASLSNGVRLLKRRISENVGRAATLADSAPFVGRESELSGLVEAMQSVRNGIGRLLLFWGEAGVGKSRLIQEAIAYAGTCGFPARLIAPARSTPLRPFSLLVEVCRHLLDSKGSLGASPETLAILRGISDMSVGDQIDSGAELDGSLIALGDVAGAVSAERPLLLAIDDIQDFDHQSRAAFSSLISALLPHRILLVVASTSEHLLAEVSSVALTAPKRLLPLREDAMRSIVEHLASQSAGLPSNWGRASVQECVNLSAGLPPSAEEIIRFWSGCGSLDPLPPNLLAPIRKRIADLSGRRRGVLQLIVALGEHCTFERLLALCGGSPQELVGEIEILERLSFLRLESAGPRVLHPVFSSVVLELLPPIARAAMHRFVAGTLVPDARRSLHLEVIADCAKHLVLAEARDEAIDLLEDAARRFAEAGSPRSAIGLLSELSTRLGLHDRSKPLYQSLMIVSARGGAYAAGLRALQQLSSACEAKPVEVAADLGAGALAIIQRTSHDWTALIARTESIVSSEAASIPERLEAGALLLALSDNLGDAFLADRSWLMLDPISPRSPDEVRARLRGEVIFHSSFGALDRADAAAKKFLELVADCPDLSVRATAAYFASTPAFLSGDVERATQLLREAHSYSEEGGLATRAMATALRLAEVALHMGEEESCEEMLRAADRSAEANEDDDNATAALALRLRSTLAFGTRTFSARYPIPLGRILKMASARQRIAHLAGYVELLAVTNGKVSKEALHQLRADLVALTSRGGLDYPVAALAMHLKAAEQVTQLRELLDNYLVTRRERGVLHHRLLPFYRPLDAARLPDGRYTAAT